MNSTYHGIRKLHSNSVFGEGDVLVLFGELFSRGYANGLADEAESRKMTVVRSTVGRRDEVGNLRKLTSEELSQMAAPVINIPMEAGFDLEPNDKGQKPVEILKTAKLSDWDQLKFEEQDWASSEQKGQNRFVSHLRQYMVEIDKLIPPGKNVIFAHLMAGGVPRTKIVMPLMNRTFKGSGDRFLPSEKLWNSSIGKFISQSFNAVTADTFDHLIRESESFRNKMTKSGGSVSYLAFGYHGTEVLIDGKYTWQSYSPYIQGWAKMRLEQYSREWSKKGIRCCVYNCPEILTNSSSVFSGVEVSLYPLIDAIKKEAPNSAKAKLLLESCQNLLTSPHSLEQICQFTNEYLRSKIIRDNCIYDQWPQHNNQAQLEKMVESSDTLISWHKSDKSVITNILSELVFKSCGRVMINDIAKPEAPVSWINHDLVAQLVDEVRS